MFLIGLGAKARQGKNFVANYIKEQCPQAKIYAFADELKLYCREHHSELLKQWSESGPDAFRFLGPPKDDPIYGYTQILQWYGTEVARANDPDTWVKALDKRLEKEKPEVGIVCDVRFPNEAAYIKEKGGTLVEVIRLKEDGEQYLDPGRDPNHPSETALNDYEGWDFIIMAKDGDLKGLKSKSIGVWNLANSNDWLDIMEEEPDYSADIYESIDSQGDGYKDPFDYEPTVD